MISQIGKISNRGVTLVEICLVGVILSLLFALGWPVLNRSIRQNQIDITCNEISYTLRYARDYALNEGRYYSVQFDPTNRQYWIAVKNNSDSNSFEPLNDSLNKTRRWPEEIKLENISAQQVIFYPDGTSQDFKISFKNNNGNACTLNLQGTTGKTTIGNQI